jgi:3-dehydroquinate dehydratase II
MASQPRLVVANGPNLNLLGTREPEIYGTATLADIQAMVDARAADLGWSVSFFQSNHEGELIDRIQKAAADGTAMMIFNPGGYTHTSIALRDALLSVALPFFEVHISNPFRREHFRRHSYFTDIAVGCISGCGAVGYELALTAAMRRLVAMPANPQGKN